jgi:hypothetical protein
MKTSTKRGLKFIATFLLFCATSVMAQNISITRHPDSMIVNGKVLKYASNGTDLEIYFYILNAASSDVSWRVECRKILTGVRTYESLCVSEKKWTGGCEFFSAGEKAYTSYNRQVRAGKYGEIKIEIKLFGAVDPGTIKYRYYVKDAQGKALDSFDVEIGYHGGGNTSIGEPSPDVFSVMPNPASDVLSINLRGLANGRLCIVDHVGRTVLETLVSDGGEIMLSDLPDGIYTAGLRDVNGRFFSRRIVVCR